MMSCHQAIDVVIYRTLPPFFRIDVGILLPSWCTDGDLAHAERDARNAMPHVMPIHVGWRLRVARDRETPPLMPAWRRSAK
jgi:hypothetical protein